MSLLSNFSLQEIERIGENEMDVYSEKFNTPNNPTTNSHPQTNNTKPTFLQTTNKLKMAINNPGKCGKGKKEI